MTFRQRLAHAFWMLAMGGVGTFGLLALVAGIEQRSILLGLLGIYCIAGAIWNIWRIERKVEERFF